MPPHSHPIRVLLGVALVGGVHPTSSLECVVAIPGVDKIQTVQPGAIVENKRLGAALALVKERQEAYAPHRRRSHPGRQRPPNNLEAPGEPSKGRPSRTALAVAPI